jgi:hypothetical protein
MGLLFFLQSKQKRTHFWTCIGTLQSLWNPANLLRYSAFKMIAQKVKKAVLFI